MKLEDISVEVRPRNPWEAIDVGFLLPISWWKSVYIPWLIVILPIIVFITIAFKGIPWLPVVIIWWLKPFYDRLLLSIFSQRLFGVTPTTEETLRNCLKLFKTGLLTNLTLLRLNPSRSFHLPVWQLEGLRGKPRQGRIKVLSARIYSFPLWLTIVCFFLEFIIYFTIVGSISLLTPESLNLDIFSLVEKSDENRLWALLLINLLFSTGMIIIEPFYVAAGFMLYINRRIRLEGWDIEIAFRKLGQRLKQPLLKMSLLIIFSYNFFSLDPILANNFSGQGDIEVNQVQLEAQESDHVISEILARDEFNNSSQVKHWSYIGDKSTANEKNNDSNIIEFIKNLGELFAVIFRSLIWIMVILLIFFIALYRHKWLWLFTRKKKTIKEHVVAEQLFGMEITPESLPADIPAAARLEFKKGNIRLALSILYRGSLMSLVNHYKLNLNESQTEGEIVLVASKHMQDDQIAYLNLLTSEWIQTAYANRLTTEESLTRLCDEWTVLRPVK